jgi:hypothetical protein
MSIPLSGDGRRIPSKNPTMTEAEIVRALRGFYESLFPRYCSGCGRSYPTLRDYIVETQRIWPSVHYELELGDAHGVEPVGGMAIAKCVCGATIVLSSSGLPPEQARVMLGWIRNEMAQRAMKAGEVLDHLRDEVRKQVMAGSP